MPHGYLWNADFTAYSGQEWAKASSDPRFALMFYEAIQERRKAIAELCDPDPANVVTPAAGDDLLAASAGGTAGGFFAQLAEFIFAVQFYFLPASVDYDGNTGLNDGGTNYGLLPFYGSTVYEGGAYTAGGTVGAGFDYQYAREIHALTDAGTDGQIARFVATSDSDRAISGKYYKHVSGSWVPAPSPTWDPDHITVTETTPWPIVSSVSGTPGQGAYFTAALCNQFRDWINRLVWIHSESYPELDPPQGVYQVSASGSPVTYSIGTVSGFTRDIEWLWWNGTAWVLARTDSGIAPTTGTTTITGPTIDTSGATGEVYFGAIMKFDASGGFAYTSATSD